MKKCCLLLAMALTTGYAYTQTVLTFGNTPVSKEEFLRAYNKNKTPVADKEKSVRDYVELYSNFKLKVKVAQEMRLDTLEQLKTDLENFRRQVEENYLNDEKAVNALMTEAFNRSQQDLHVLRFSIAADPEAAPADSITAYNNIRQVYQQLKAGSTQYDIITSGTGSRYVDMGYVTAFSLPYAYENIIYQLKAGEVSAPYRAKKAWHVFKLIESRKSAGKWKVAQILFTLPPEAGDAAKAEQMRRADSVYQLIAAGADFGEMAKMFSDDKLTYLTGGEMPEFGAGKFDVSFEKEVFALQKDGDVSRPFQTSFGVHIIKRLGQTPIPSSKDDPAFQYELKQKLMQDDRIKSAKAAFAKEVLSKIGYKPAAVKEADLFRYADTIMADPMGGIASKLPISDKPVMHFAKGNAKGEDWLNYVRDYKTNGELYKGESNAELWTKFKDVAAMNYYRKHLEEYNADFKYQLQEFKEGNMLFEVMERKVWSQASADSAGLKQYYNEHAAQYKWGASADALIINAVAEKEARDAIDSLKAGWNWQLLIESKPGELQGDSSRFELSQIGALPDAAPGTFSPITRNPDGTATFIKYFRFYENGQQRSFEDSRGMVINDYQQVLEKKWIESLRKKYPVKVNEAVVKAIIAGL